MYIETSSPRKPGQKARLRSEVLNMHMGGCFTFWYHMYGQTMGTLNLYMDTSVGIATNSIQRIWYRSGNQKNQWQNAAVSVQSSKNFRLVFEGVTGASFTSDIAIDDVRMTPGLCGSTSAPSPSFTCKSGQVIPPNQVCDFTAQCSDKSDEVKCGNCTFETDLCNWNDVSVGSYRWQRGRNSSLSASQGPPVDHTTRTARGYFMYVDAAHGMYNSKSSLQSPVLQQSFSTCQVQFYYMLGGASRVGTISVSIQVGTRNTEIWRRHTNQGMKWMRATADIGRVKTKFQVLIQATKNFASSGVVAIDDISMVNCGLPPVQQSCAANQFRCNRGSCVDNSQLCDFTDDCGDNSDETASVCSAADRCTFERSMCSWTQDTSDQFNWLRHRGRTRSANTGPTRDHTTNLNSGYYIYIESSAPRKPNDKARLISRAILPAKPKDGCVFTFYYHMFGTGTGTLNVYIQTKSGGYKTRVWTKSGNRGDFWERATIALSSAQTFQLVLEGVRGSSYYGDIAVDDVIIGPKCRPSGVTLPTAQYPVTTAKSACSGSSFQCVSDKKCIPASRVCDFTPDCADKSDEAICGACTFEPSGRFTIWLFWGMLLDLFVVFLFCFKLGGGGVMVNGDGSVCVVLFVNFF